MDMNYWKTLQINSFSDTIFVQVPQEVSIPLQE